MAKSYFVMVERGTFDYKVWSLRDRVEHRSRQVTADKVWGQVFNAINRAWPIYLQTFIYDRTWEEINDVR